MGVITIEITEMDEVNRRWTDVTQTGPFRGTKGLWQMEPEDGGSQRRCTLMVFGVCCFP